ncbi:MAG: hypothetical protein KDD33_04405 [Bdellovibrionales bacterium]|nr:hypothetical protein [Bdellovibrionales bacterium]
MNLFRWLLFLTFVACLSLTLLGLVLDIGFQVYYQPLISQWQKTRDQQLSQYRKEKAHFEQHSFFSSTEMESGEDFADFLLSRLNKEDPQALINKRLQSQVLSSGNEWTAKLNWIEPKEAILEIFNGIKLYKRWSLHRTLQSFPNLSAIELVVAGKIYLNHTIHKDYDNIKAALENVRHMARLLTQSENLNFQLAGLSLLEKERDVLDFIAARKLALTSEWQTFEQKELDRYRDFLFSTYEYFDLMNKPQQMNAIFVEDSLPTGFCSIYHKKRPLIANTVPLLTNSFPFEPTFQSHLDVLEKIDWKARENCQSYVERARKTLGLWAHLPYLRRIVAFKQIIDYKSLRERQ